MNELYALDPCVPNNYRDLKVLLDQFGPYTGRFLSKYPDYFLEEVPAALANLPPIERSKMLELWNKRKHVFLPNRELFYNMAKDWASNVADVQARKRAFADVISQRDNGHGWRVLEDVLYEEPGLPPGQGAHIKMMDKEYEKCVKPLMDISAEVTLLDPYFRLRDNNGFMDRRRWPVMTALVRATIGSRCESFRFRLSSRQAEVSQDAEEEFRQDVAAIQQEEKAEKIKVDVKFLKDDEIGHGRYIFSICGGLQFDQGFEVQKGKTNHVHWLSQPELDPILKRFSPRTEQSGPRR